MPSDIGAFARSTFRDWTGFHLQRYQIPNEVAAWRELIVPDLHVIDLRRDDLLAQYRSWRLAMDSDQWHPFQLDQVSASAFDTFAVIADFSRLTKRP